MPAPYSGTTPVPELAVQRLAALLGTINVGNGYLTDVEAVYRFRLAGWELAEAVAIVLLGTEQTLQRVVGMPPRYNVALRVEGQAHIPVEPTEELEPACNALMADVCRALDSDLTLADCVREMSLETWKLAVTEAEAPYGVADFSIVIKYQAESADMTRPH